MSRSPDPFLLLGNSAAKGSSAPKGRKTIAQGKALGPRHPTNPSPEGAERSRQENCEWLGESKVPKETYGLKIPAHWRWSTFGYLSERVTVGHVGSMKDEYLEAGIPFLRGQNVRANRYDSKGLKYISAAFHKSLKKSALEPFDIVVTRSGDVGIACVIPEHLGDANCSDLVIIKRPHGIDSHFAAYYLNSAAKRFITAGKVGVAITHFNTKSVADLPVPLPPILEQRRIVARIEELFSRLAAGVAALRHSKAQLQRYRQSVLAAAVTGELTREWREQHPDTEPAEELLKRILKLRPSEWTGRGKYMTPEPPVTDGLPGLPETWSWTNFETLAKAEKHALKAGPFGSALKKEFYVPSGYKIYGQEQVINDDPYFGDYYIDEERFQSLKSCETKPGDFLISLVGTIGRTMIVPDDAEPGIINPRLVKMSLDQRLIDPRLLKIYLSSSQVKAFFKIVSHGGTMDVLNLTTLKALPIPLPPLAEIPQIIEAVEARTTAIDHLEAELDRQITRASRLRQAILANAFSGEGAFV